MKNIWLITFMVTFVTQFSTAFAADAPSQIFVTAGELETLSVHEIVLKVAVGQRKLPAYGEKIPDDLTIYENRTFMLDSATKCFDADESTASKLNKSDHFLVYMSIDEIACPALTDNRNLTVYHMEDQNGALAIRDNGLPQIPIFGVGSSASPITNEDGAAFVMQMLGTAKPNSADPILQQLQIP